MDVEDNNNKMKKEKAKSNIDLGAFLIEARNNLSLSVNDIASELRLSVEVIEKIEQNQFDMDLPTTFIRGYVKSYASYVGLDTEGLLAQFDQEIVAVSPSLKSLQSISRFDSKRKEINSASGVFKGLTLFIIVIFLTLASWEVWNRYKPQIIHLPNDNQIDLNTDGELSTESIDLQELSLSTDTSDLGEAVDANKPQQYLQPQDQEKAQDSATIAAIPATDTALKKPPFELNEMAPNNAIDALDSTNLDDTNPNSQTFVFRALALDFTDQCWVKITDARGEILANGIKLAGKHMPLQGVAPIKVVLGNPNVVSMTYQGKAYLIKKYPSGARAIITLQ